MMYSHLYYFRTNQRVVFYGYELSLSVITILRFRLLERMQARASDRRFDSKTKFEVNYDDVKNIKIVKPTIKKYLYAYC